MIDLLEGMGGNVDEDLGVGALTELVGKDREVVQETVPARVHNRQIGRIVLDGPKVRPPTGRDHEVRRARVLGRLVAEVTRVELNALVRQRSGERQLKGASVREQSLGRQSATGDLDVS